MQILVLIIGLLFIVISVSRAYMIMVWVLVRETIGSTGLNTSVLSGERVRHIECNILDFLVLSVHTHDTTLKKENTIRLPRQFILFVDIYI